MAQALKPPPTHREVLPVRECLECGAYLTSANEDAYCALHGGWITQRLFEHAAKQAMIDLYVELAQGP